ncbi:MAG: hypothetical protein QOH69_2425 [Actinomycetota bacterium]|jgi:hypothetical protein|nr:hypothetical protein [Actinomycetota bacterium]
MSNEPSDAPAEKTSEPLALQARATIVLGVALVVAILAAIGIQGNLLARMVRDNEWGTILVFAGIVIGVALPVLSISSKHPRIKAALRSGAFVLVLVSALGAVVLASVSSQDREMPAVSIDPSWNAANQGVITLTVTGSATSLRSTENLLLRVVALKDVQGMQIKNDCNTDESWWFDPPLGSHGEILSWGQTGPDVSGSASAKVVVKVDPKKYDLACAYVGLSGRSNTSSSGNRSDFTVLNLESPKK